MNVERVHNSISTQNLPHRTTAGEYFTENTVFETSSLVPPLSLRLETLPFIPFTLRQSALPSSFIVRELLSTVPRVGNNREDLVAGDGRRLLYEFPSRPLVLELLARSGGTLKLPIDYSNLERSCASSDLSDYKDADRKT